MCLEPLLSQGQRAVGAGEAVPMPGLVMVGDPFVMDCLGKRIETVQNGFSHQNLETLAALLCKSISIADSAVDMATQSVE